MKNFLARIGVVLLFAVGLIALNAQNDKQPAPTNQPSAVAQQQNDGTTQDTKPFTGTIMKEKGKLVLKEDATKMSYQLDDQEKAKPFEGKQVKVTGKLDVDANLIHVENIEATS